MNSTTTYLFGDFRLDTSGRVLLRRGRRVPLTPKALHLLVVLVEGGGNPVSKEELLSRVWGGDLVEEGSLAWHISLLRKALEDDAAGRRFIETIPRHGYRFASPVQEVLASAGRLEPGFRVAVLPLQDARPKEEGAVALADGLTDEIARALSSVGPPRIGVIGRASTRGYKDCSKGATRIARELEVEYVLDGKIQREGKRARFSMQLVDGRDRTIAWANSYERDISDIFGFQSDLASVIAGEIQAVLYPSQEVRDHVLLPSVSCAS
jgi:DNA-binding winged helix-turn-helix (wHTH) protein